MDRRLVVLYGSQTGTAQEVAERVGREATRLHFSVCVSSFDGFSIQKLPTEPLVVYVVSTTGQGEEPDNMRKAWRFLLRKSLPSNSLSGQRHAVLGLGDSSYTKFNHVAKKLSKRLLQIGGCELLAPGLGDDQHDLGPDFVIDSWLQQLWDLTLQLYPLPPGLEPITKQIKPPPKYKLEWIDKPSLIHPNGFFSAEYNQSDPFASTVISCSRQTPVTHFQDVRLVRLDISESSIKYEPGDVALVQPSNLKENVDFFFSLFSDLDPEALFTLSTRDPNTPLPPTSILPQPCTVRRAVQTYFDVQSIPRRHFFELLAHFTTDETEKEKFIEFDTAEGQQDLYEYCNRPRRNILEVLYDFRYTAPNLPFNYLFNLIPAIKPRSFSISSSQLKHGNVLELLVAVVQYRSNLKTPRRGLCSNWLASLQPGDKVPVWTRTGTLKFPSDPQVPVVMVGPGTGVAPFRSYISDQHSRQSKRSLKLFFGCRNKDCDFFFSSEYRELGNVQVITAFSRDQEDKVYVQHRMGEMKDMLAEMVVNRGGWFYVAGNSKFMPAQVREALVEACDTRDGKGKDMVQEMENKGKYQTETWA